MTLDKIPQKTLVSKGRKDYIKTFQDLYEQVGAGMVPPHSIELEQSVLGSMMIDRSAVGRAIEVIGDRTLDDSPFYRDAHTPIYRAILDVDKRGVSPDLLTVTEQLRKEGQLERVGGASYLVELTSRVVTTANVEAHARIIVEKHLGREMIRMFEECKLRVFRGEDDTFDLLEYAESALFQLASVRHSKSYSHVKSFTGGVIEDLIKVDNAPNTLLGVPTHLHDLNALMLGWQKGTLNILAARPSQGKTALSLAFTRAAAMLAEKFGVLFFSLEMGANELTMRLLCSIARVDSHSARKGRLKEDDWRRLTLAAARLNEAPIFIDDTPAISVLELRAKARRLMATEKIGFIVVDYLQLMTPSKSSSSSNREQDISSISRGLKALAKELDVPVLALSQLSRSVENRKPPRPMLSDLRESGAIEADADNVIFIYRPETYGVHTDEYGNSTEGLVELIVAKHRSGPIGEVMVSFLKDTGEFKDRADQAQLKFEARQEEAF